METRQMEKELQLTQRFLNFFKILILVRIVFRNSKRLNLKSLQEFKFRKPPEEFSDNFGRC